jgi:hypothetical protein
MNTRESRSSRHDGSEDVGTLWTMHRREHSARCALIALRHGWEVRVLMGRDVLLEERCERADEAFSVAELWRTRMVRDGWHQVVPAPFRDHSQRPLAR